VSDQANGHEIINIPFGATTKQFADFEGQRSRNHLKIILGGSLRTTDLVFGRRAKCQMETVSNDGFINELRAFLFMGDVACVSKFQVFKWEGGRRHVTGRDAKVTILLWQQTSSSMSDKRDLYGRCSCGLLKLLNFEFKLVVGRQEDSESDR
jgi:hypothetical protein